MITINKITVMGGGSSYTPEFIDGFIQHSQELQVGEIVLYDINEKRLEIVGGMARRMMAHAGLSTRITTTSHLISAVKKASFIISQIRVGMMPARRNDESIPLKYNVMGQETTGPGGFMNALRTIPVTLAIAEDVRKYAPFAWYINFTNPAGIITESLIKHAKLKTVGLCNVPITTLRYIAEIFRVKDEDVFLDWVGLNHLAWVRGIYIKGKNMTSQALKPPLISKLAQSRVFPHEAGLIQTLGMFPVSYLKHYYNRTEMLEKLKKASRTRAEEVMKIEKRLFKEYGDPKTVIKPPELDKRGGTLYSEAALRLIISLATGKPSIQILNVKNNGSIKDLPDDVSVEVPCLVQKDTVRPLNCSCLPKAIRSLVLAVKFYEEYAVEAAVTGSRLIALKAMLTHPLVPSYSVAKSLLDEMLKANRDYLPLFFKKQA